MSSKASSLKKWWKPRRHRARDGEDRQMEVAEASSTANTTRAFAIRPKGTGSPSAGDSCGEGTPSQAGDTEVPSHMEPLLEPGRNEALKNVQEPGLHVIFNGMPGDQSTSHLEAADIDIVAVHGLNFRGHADHAWATWTKGNKVWLRDFLPEYLGRPSRVMLFAYNSSPAIDAIAIRFDDHAKNLLQWLHLRRKDTPKRPLIFICHSLGGLVVKEALVEATLDSSYKSIVDATRLIVFFATPHQGGNHASVGSIVAKLARAALHTPGNDLLEALKQTSDVATKRFEQSRHLADKFLIVSFFETQPYGKIGIIVDKKSATLNLPGSREKQVAIDAGHSAICKFDSVDSSVCQLILGTITTEVKRALEIRRNSQVFESDTSPQPSALIPFYRDDDFVRRGDILDRIDQIVLPAPHRAALVGLGGVGKSQLAIEFAYQIREKSANMWVFWVYAGTRTRVEEGLRAIADAVQLPGRDQPAANIPQLIYHWLSNEKNGQWLMVLDSADDQDVLFSTAEGTQERALSTYLPQSANGCILVTTRDKQLADRITGKRDRSIEVGPMSETEALTLLKTKLGPETLWDEEIGGALVQTLDFVPLAISQAAAYIQARAPRSSLGQYLDEFRKGERTKTKLLEYEVGDLRRDGGASNSVLTTWRISFDHIRSKRPSAADLLSFMSFFDRQGIPEWVLKDEKVTKRAYYASDNGPTEDRSNGGSDDEGNADDQFEDDLAILRDYCLVTVNEGGNEFEMHSLVQLSTRKWLAASSQQEWFQKQYVKRLAAVFPGAKYESWATCRALFVHAQAALKYRPNEANEEEVGHWAILLYNAGGYAFLQGIYELAEEMVGEAWRALEKRFGKERPVTLKASSLFARVIKARGRWDEAERLEMEAMEIQKATLGVDHPETLSNMNNLGLIFVDQGRWNEAERLLLEAVEIRKAKLGAGHSDTLASIHNLASLFTDQGRWDEAERLQLEVAETWKATLGANHPDTLTSINSLALIFLKQGRWDEAERLLLEVVEKRKVKLGADHPETLISINNLALTLLKQGQRNEAERLLLEVVEMQKATLGADHPDTLMAIHNLARTWKLMGRLADAAGLMKSCVEASRRVLGQDHPRILSSEAALAEWSADTSG